LRPVTYLGNTAAAAWIAAACYDGWREECGL